MSKQTFKCTDQNHIITEILMYELKQFLNKIFLFRKVQKTCVLLFVVEPTYRTKALSTESVGLQKH